eukprot:jgi/Bigna1/36445/e_gw1.14.27.1
MKSLWRRDPGLALTGSLLLVSAKAAKILVPVLYKLIFDQIEHVTTDAVSMTTATLFGVSALVLGHMGARSVAQGLQSINDVIFARSVQTVTRDLGRRSLSRLLALDASFYTNANVGAMTRVVERGMRATQTVLSRLFMHLVPQFVELTIVAYIIYLKAGVAMAAGAVATVTAYAAFTLATVKKRNVFLREMNVQDNQATGRVLETLLNYEVVNSFNRQEHQIDSYDKTLQQYQKAQRGSLRQLALLNFGQRTIEAVGQGALLLRTALLVSTGAMTIGDLLMVNALLAQLMGPLDHLGANYMQLTQGLIEGKELYRLIDTQTNVSANADCPPLKVKSGTIEIKNITFGYPSSAQDAPLFQGFDLTIEGGKTIGIVGESGCGKSTLSRLLTRFYDVQGGKILVDEQDISKDVSLASVRHAITTVSQDTKLFNEDILSNLKYGAPDASNEDVERVTEKVQLSEDIKAMDGGYETVVGDRGSRLSGGQRQRAGLGRALLKNPDILICDEVTGALDVGTESRVMQSLYEMRKGRTTVVIAHRLATVKEADEIIVMKAGKIAERGSHLELTSRPDSLYSAMWKQQLQEGGSEHTHDHHHHHHHHHYHHHHHDEHEEDHLQQEISSWGGGGIIIVDVVMAIDVPNSVTIALLLYIHEYSCKMETQMIHYFEDEGELQRRK